MDRDIPIVCLVETAVGVSRVEDIAPHAARLAFGALDLAADLACAPTNQALHYARSRIILASRLGDLPAPLDGVTANFRDLEAVEEDSWQAVQLGFGGKLCIHPSQVKPVKGQFALTPEDIAWAKQVLELDDGVAVLNGQMIDAPIRLRARAIYARSTQRCG